MQSLEVRQEGGLSPWLKHRVLEAKALEVIRCAKEEGTCVAQERYEIRDYMTLVNFLEKHGVPLSECQGRQTQEELLAMVPRVSQETQELDLVDLLVGVINLMNAERKGRHVGYLPPQTVEGKEVVLSAVEPPLALEDPAFSAARLLCQQGGRVSVSSLQRRLRVGLIKATSIYQKMVEEGLVDNGWAQKRRDNENASQ